MPVCVLLSLFLASGLCLHRALADVNGSVAVWLALAPAGFAYGLVGRLTFDLYYLPTLRRHSDDASR